MNNPTKPKTDQTKKTGSPQHQSQFLNLASAGRKESTEPWPPVVPPMSGDAPRHPTSRRECATESP